MKLTSLIALFTLALAGVEAIGPDDHLHYKGNFHAPHKLELTKMSINRVSRCSSSAGALPTGNDDLCVLVCPPGVHGDCHCKWEEGACICEGPPPCGEECKCVLKLV
jgi:hypothetical protein